MLLKHHISDKYPCFKCSKQGQGSRFCKN